MAKHIYKPQLDLGPLTFTTCELYANTQSLKGNKNRAITVPQRVDSNDMQRNLPEAAQGQGFLTWMLRSCSHANSSSLILYTLVQRPDQTPFKRI